MGADMSLSAGILHRLSEKETAECLAGGELPGSSWGFIALREPLGEAMTARLGKLDYWEWRVPENICLTDLRGKQKRIAPSFGLPIPSNWEELVNLAVAIVETMRRSPDSRKALINLEQSDEEKRRAENRSREFKTAGVIVGVVGALAGVAGMKAAATASASARAQLQKETLKAEAEIAALDVQREAAMPLAASQITGLSTAGKLALGAAAVVSLILVLR